MIELPKPEVICTHESDLDGLVSGLLLKRLADAKFGSEIALEAYHYQGWKMRSLSERSAWISDFTFEPRMDRPNWVVIDHHSIDTQPRHAKLIHDSKKSAAALCYELCVQSNLGTAKLAELVRLTNIGDLFLYDEPDFDLACDYGSLVKAYGFWPLNTLIEANLENLVDHPLLEVIKVKRKIEDPMGFNWARDNVDRLSASVGLVQTIIGNTNLIVHRLLAEKAVPYAVLVTLFKKGNNQIIVSFRSQNGEALAVAAQLGGGGHPNAAGTTLPQGVRDLEAAALYLKQVLNPKLPSQSDLNSLESAFAALKI